MATSTDRAQRTVDSVFKEHGREALYTPPTGVAVACTVIRNSADQAIDFGSGRPVAAGDIIEVRKSEVLAPKRGGTFTMSVGGDVVRIMDDARSEDPDRLVWVMTVA